MKRAGVLLLLCSLLVIREAHGAQWARSFGGVNDEFASSIQQTADGGFIVAGQTSSFGAGGYDAWVLKLNPDGLVAWQKTYGGSGGDLASSIQQTADGGFIVAARTLSYGAGDADAWVLKLNPDGSVAWQKTYGGSGLDFASSIQQTADGGFIVAGSTRSFGAGGSDAWVLKLNADGSPAWERSFRGVNDDFGYSIQQTSDGGFIMAGQTSSFGAGGSDAWVLKINADGSPAWANTYGGSANDSAWSVQETADGGFIVGGRTSSFGKGLDDAWVLKLNANGSVAWQKTYGGSGHDYANSVQQIVDGGFIVAGYTASLGAGRSDVWVLKLDSQGGILGCSAAGTSSCTVGETYSYAHTAAAVSSSTANPAVPTIQQADTSAVPAQTCSFVPSSAQWQKTYGGSKDDSASSIRQTADGGYIVAGSTASFGAGGFDAWGLRLNPDGSPAWQKTYGGASLDSASSIQQTADGGFIVAGETSSFHSGNREALVLKLNADGSTAWANTYGGGFSTITVVGTSVQETADDGFIVVSSSILAGNADVWVLRLNNNGSVAWEKIYQGGDSASSIQQTADGGFIVAGSTTYFGAGGSDAWVLRLNAGGSVIWEKAYGGPGSDLASSIQQTADGGFILAGSTRSFGAGGSDAWVLRLDAGGTVTWQKTYGGSGEDSANSIQQTADGGFILAGSTRSFGAGGSDAWVLKLKADGSVTWQKTYGGSGEDSANSIQQTADGGFILAGSTRSFGAGGSDVWVLKLDREGGIRVCGAVAASSAVAQDSVAAPIVGRYSSGANTSLPSYIVAPAVSNTAATPVGVCTATYALYLLDVHKEGSGRGTVTSVPPGISCGDDCNGIFMTGSLVDLNAAAERDSRFVRWEGACNADGLVTMNADKRCAALFNSIVDFSGIYRSGVAPLTVAFTDLSSNSPTGWWWSFGDGGTSLAGNPTHTYTFPGVYPVSLSVTGPGAQGSIAKEDFITVNCGPSVRAVRFGTPPSTWAFSDSMQSAYDEAADGNYVEPISVAFEGNLTFGKNKRITLKGGFDCAFSSSGWFTTVRGTMTIGGAASGTGSVTVENIIIR